MIKKGLTNITWQIACRALFLFLTVLSTHLGEARLQESISCQP